MRKIYVLHENNEWTIHLQNSLDELRLPYEFWHLDEGLIDLSTEPPKGVFYNRITASSHTRDNRFAPEFTEAVLAWLERHGRIVVNGSTALRLEAIQYADGISYAYDVNTNTNCNSDAEKIAGQFAMLELAKYLAARLQES